MVVPLIGLEPGERGVVVNIAGGSGLRSRLYAMGIAPGVIIRVLEKHQFGPVVVEAGTTRLAVGRGMAGKVLVRKV
ncbi:ferrous iron transport protein A [Thermococcus sp. Bubb.Bath]|nr:FeoA family protein [Thermococcus sp. Bubb.Bath]NJF25955.1 ferrous iron transport protein A [Thermococcus sp. Bubb.Bath]